MGKGGGEVFLGATNALMRTVMCQEMWLYDYRFLFVVFIVDEAHVIPIE